MLCSHKPLDPANEVPARPRKPLLDRKCTESTWNLNFVCFGSKTSTLSSHHPTWLQRKTRGDPRLPFRRELHQDHIESECSLPQKPYCPVLFLVQQRTACWESAAATHCNLTDMKMPCNKNQCVKLPKKKTKKKKNKQKQNPVREKWLENLTWHRIWTGSSKSICNSLPNQGMLGETRFLSACVKRHSV